MAKPKVCSYQYIFRNKAIQTMSAARISDHNQGYRHHAFCCQQLEDHGFELVVMHFFHMAITHPKH
jgi:hypothetical protein